MAVLQKLSEKITVQIYEKVDKNHISGLMCEDPLSSNNLWINYLLPKTALIVELLALLATFWNTQNAHYLTQEPKSLTFALISALS